MSKAWIVSITTAVLLACIAAQGFSAEAPKGAPGFKHCGLYVHGCWLYNYPFATHSWNRQDYDHMFRLLKTLGYDRVMLWPMLEGIPMPMSAEDAAALREYRNIIEDAHQEGLQCWLTQSICTTDRKIAEKPWKDRNFYAVRKDVRLDDPAQAEPWFKQQADMFAILNNFDAYVTIDSDPGGYLGAKAEDFVKVFQHDRQIIDRVGVCPEKQSVMPWVWMGWGTVWWGERGGAATCAASHELEVYKAAMKDGWEVMQAARRRVRLASLNMAVAEKAGLMPYSTLILYDSLEGQPSPPNTNQFEDIRHALRQERQYAGAAGVVSATARRQSWSCPTSTSLFGLHAT